MTDRQLCSPPAALAALFALALLAGAIGCAGGGSTTTVSLGLTATQIDAGQTFRANAVATDSGLPMAGATVQFSVAPSWVASASAQNATADSEGRASITVTGTAAGTVYVTALVNGHSSETRTCTVVGPTWPEHVLFLGGPDSTYQVVPNMPGNASAAAAPLGDGRWVLGAQRAGEMALVIPRDVQADSGWIRNLHTGVEATFGYAGFRPLIPLQGPRTAAIASAGDRVYWLQQVSGSTRILAADLYGANASTLYTPPPSAADPRPLEIELSPDDSTLVFRTVANRIYRIPATGGTATELIVTGATGARALWWESDSSLLVAVSARTATGHPAILRLPAAGGAPTVVYDDGGAGLRSTPWTLTTDWQGNILFDERSATGADTDLYRLRAPGFATEEAILARSEVDAYPTIVNY